MPLTRKAFLKSLAGLAAARRPVLARGKPRSSRPSRPPPAARGGRASRTAEFAPFDMRLKQTFRTALGAESVEREVLVRLRTADGLTGWGEASPYWAVTSETQETNLTLAKDLAGFVRGRDPFTVARILADMDALQPGQSQHQGRLRDGRLGHLRQDRRPAGLSPARRVPGLVPDRRHGQPGRAGDDGRARRAGSPAWDSSRSR